MISDLCERDDHGACFDDELDGCRCACHPTDCLAGIGGTTTEQPSTGGARQAAPPKRADGNGPTPTVRAACGTLAPGSAGRAVPPSPVGGAAHLSSPQRRERAAAAETPGPETAPSPPLGKAAVRARVKTPAGSTGRTWTLELPAGMELLSLNGREHWAARHRKTQALKDAAIVMARKTRLPRLRRVSVVAEYQPPDRRRRDADNPVASVKAAIDGIVAAGCLPGDDSPRYVAEVTCRIGELYPKGRLVLHLTEISAATGSDAV